jgi:hypothetical protein
VAESSASARSMRLPGLMAEGFIFFKCSERAVSNASVHAQAVAARCSSALQQRLDTSGLSQEVENQPYVAAVAGVSLLFGLGDEISLSFRTQMLSCSFPVDDLFGAIIFRVTLRHPVLMRNIKDGKLPSLIIQRTLRVQFTETD